MAADDKPTASRDSAREVGRDSSPAVKEPAPKASSSSLSAFAVVPFKRRFLVPTLALGFAELIGIFYPLWVTFDFADLAGDTLIRTALPVAIGGVMVWLAAITAWLLPLWQAVQARRRGERVHKELAARAYRATLKGPVRVLLL
nr:hypothetical protein [Deltaproteobacteria bacterium]